MLARSLGCLPSFCLPRKDQVWLEEQRAASWGLSKERANKNRTKANQFLKTKILLQAGTKNTGLNKRQVGVPSSSQLPPHPHCHGSMAQGPEAGAKLLLPEGTPCSCHLSAACDPLASAARKDKMRGLPMSLSKGFSPLKGPRKETEGQFPIYFDKKLKLPGEEGHPLSF